MSYYRKRAEANRWRLCDVESCSKHRHDGSRYCNRHHLREQRYGDPTGVSISKKQLAPYKKLADRFLRANASHPAIVTVCGELDRRLTEAVALVDARGPMGPEWRPAANDTRGKEAFELRRLRDGGATGVDLLRSALTLHLFVSHLQTIERFTVAYDVALCRAILLTRPLSCHVSPPHMARSGRSEPRLVHDYISSRVLRDLGHRLAVALCVVLDAAAKSIDAERAKPQPSRAERLARAIDALPFTASTAATTTERASIAS